jgi:hypothetical protein
VHVLYQEVGLKESEFDGVGDRLGPEVHAPSPWKIPGQTSVGPHDRFGADCLLFEARSIQPILANAPAPSGGNPRRGWFRQSRRPETHRRAAVEIVLPAAPCGNPDGSGSPGARVALRMACRGGTMVG